MAENETARGVASIVVKFRLMLEHSRKGSRIEQTGFWLDGCSFSFQRGSRLRRWWLEARNHSGSPGLHIRYKSKFPLVCSFKNTYPLECFHHRQGILHSQQIHPIRRVNCMSHNARSLPNDPRCGTEKESRISIQNTFNIDRASE